MIDPHRKEWNEQEQTLQDALKRSKDLAQVAALFQRQHAMLHSSGMTPPEERGEHFWSFDDEVWEGLSDQAARRIPKGCEHSIVWLVWHMARCEDITMNVFVLDQPQVLYQDEWIKRVNTPIHDTGNALNPDEIASFSAVVDIPSLRAYRTAVGCRTRKIVWQLAPEMLKQTVDPRRIEQVRASRDVVEAASYLLDYWGTRTITGLLLMPPTRHNFVHLNEAMRLKNKRQ